MADKPILIFPNPTAIERSRKKTGFGSANYRYPDVNRQKDRLTPKFQSMRQSFITDSSTGIEPETVLVLEVVGESEDFIRAVKAIDGLEWLAEIDIEEIKPDNDFYLLPKIGKRLLYSKIDSITTSQSSELWDLLKQHEFIDDKGFITVKPIDDFEGLIPSEFADDASRIIDVLETAATPSQSFSGRLFLSMSNQRAIEDLLTLWNQWDTTRKLPRGYQKWSEIFSCLKGIRRWDVTDRMAETGVLEYWEENLEFYQTQDLSIPFEIELWFRESGSRRGTSINQVRGLVESEEGRVIKTCTIEEIRFCALKAELPAEKIRRVLESDYVDLFKSNDVMFFRPTGQCAVELLADGDLGEFSSGHVAGDPIVGILDGVPFTSHDALRDRLTLDDPDDYSSRYQASERIHGTAMSSLICHGELDSNSDSLNRPIYIRPIMVPNPNGINRVEHIPEDEFFEDLIERAVRRMFEGIAGEEAVAPTIKIVNISIGDPARVFYHRLSPVARLLDWLSFKYGILFCVSGGNISGDINIGLLENEFSSLEPEDQTKHMLQILHNNSRNHRIIAPGESINAITAGVLHSDHSTIGTLGTRIDVLHDTNLPSPISPCGFGYRSSIKPEIFVPSGRQLYNYVQGHNITISRSSLPPGQKVARAPIVAGETTRATYTCGTSNSAALTTRSGAIIFETLQELFDESETDVPDENIAPLIKALLIHSASWGRSKDALEKFSSSSLNRNSITRYLGFGVPNLQRVRECTRQRATVIGYGQIKKDERHEYKLPLPPSLSDLNEERKLTITLAWISPVSFTSRNYRKANLTFDPPKMGIADDRIEADANKVKKGTVQQEVLTGSRATRFVDGDMLIVPVECREDAGALDETVNYGLAVTLEVREDLDVSIYDEIKDRIVVPIAIQENQ